MFTDFVHLYDARMFQVRRRFDLAAEPRLLLGTGVTARQNHLERDDAIRLQLPRFVNHAHAATTDLGKDLVPRHVRADIRQRSRECLLLGRLHQRA